MLKIKHNLSDIQDQLKSIHREAVRQTCAHAINSAVRSVRKQGAMHIVRSRVSSLTRADAAKRIKAKFTSPKKPISHMVGRIKFSGLDLPLIYFNPRELAVNTSRGVRYAILTSSSGRTMSTNAFHLLYRKGGALTSGVGKGFGASSLPFERNRSGVPRIEGRPSLASIVRTKNIERKLREIAVQRFVARFKASFDYYCKRSIRKNRTGRERQDTINKLKPFFD